MTHWIICRDCKTEHIKNCSQCLGFGLTKAYSLLWIYPKRDMQISIPCPVCGSTAQGWKPKEKSIAYNYM